MSTVVNIHPQRKTRRIRPLKAWRHMQTLLRDNEDTEQVFHIIDALNGNTLEKTLRAFASTPEGQARLKERRYLPDLLDDHETIRQLPAGTVGRAYVEFMQREGLSAAGLVAESEKWSKQQVTFEDDLAFFGNRLRDTHDLFHVLSGYGRDQLGEATLLGFSHSQYSGRGNLFISYIGGRDISKLAPREAQVMKVLAEGRKNGRMAKKIASQDIKALLAEPLEAARERLGIVEPVLYKRALKIMNDAGYQGQLSAA